MIVATCTYVVGATVLPKAHNGRTVPIRSAHARFGNIDSRRSRQKVRTFSREFAKKMRLPLFTEPRNRTSDYITSARRHEIAMTIQHFPDLCDLLGQPKPAAVDSDAAR